MRVRGAHATRTCTAAARDPIRIGAPHRHRPALARVGSCVRIQHGWRLQVRGVLTHLLMSATRAWHLTHVAMPPARGYRRRKETPCDWRGGRVGGSGARGCARGVARVCIPPRELKPTIGNWQRTPVVANGAWLAMASCAGAAIMTCCAVPDLRRCTSTASALFA